MVTWWGTRKRVSSRMWLEVQAMRAAFGNTFNLNVPHFGDLYWIGTVEINLSTLKGREHTLKIVYPKEYPDRPPVAFVQRPHIHSPRHQYEDGQLCLFNPVDGQGYGWNPGRSTAATITAWSIEWLYAYYTFRATGNWPGVEESVYRDNPHSLLQRRRQR